MGSDVGSSKTTVEIARVIELRIKTNRRPKKIRAKLQSIEMENPLRLSRGQEGGMNGLLSHPNIFKSECDRMLQEVLKNFLKMLPP